MRLRMRSGRESSSLLACLLPGSAFMKYPTLGQLTDERAAWSQLWQLSTSSLSWKSNRIACLLLAWGEMQLQHAQLQSPIVAACPPATSTATPTPPATAPPSPNSLFEGQVQILWWRIRFSDLSLQLWTNLNPLPYSYAKSNRAANVKFNAILL